MLSHDHLNIMSFVECFSDSFCDLYFPLQDFCFLGRGCRFLSITINGSVSPIHWNVSIWSKIAGNWAIK